MLCNPWRTEDVFGSLPSDQIGEYVLNDHGRVYLGSSAVPRSIPWYLGQFERTVLSAALALLDKRLSIVDDQLDPCVILRRLAASIRSDVDGNNGIFPMFVPNASDTSSAAILDQYLQFNGEHSRTGSRGIQWQYAAVLCSLCRSLGIPCRMVTVYNPLGRTDTRTMGVAEPKLTRSVRSR
jgi:transglutaminase 1